MQALLFRLSQPAQRYLTPILSTAVIVSLTFVAISGLNISNTAHSLQNEITTDFQLQQLSGQVIHLNEVLTMSARMAATTEDLSWEKRYKAYEPILLGAINQAIALTPETYNLQTQAIDEANFKILEMENKAIELVHDRKPKQALTLLFSDSYNQQKAIYTRNVQQWKQFLDHKIENDLKRHGQGLFWSGIFSMTSFWMLTLAWIGMLYMRSQYIHHRKTAEKVFRQANRQMSLSDQALQNSQASLHHQEIVLESTRQTLHQAQAQIMRDKKMSRLGQLAAGSVQEIHPPVNFIHANLAPVKHHISSLLGLISTYKTHYPEPVPALQAQLKTTDLEYIQTNLPDILDSMTAGAQRIRQIVQSLYNFSSSDGVVSQSVNIHDGIENTLTLLQHRLTGTSDHSAIHIVRDYGPLPTIEGYTGLLNQVLMTLIANAIDALDEACATKGDRNRGQITLRTNTFTDTFNVPWVTIIIADTGLGIPEAIQGRIFDAFFTTKPIDKGTGVGLSISYDIITQKHNGMLTFSSRPEEGTEFIVKLPVSLKAPAPQERHHTETQSLETRQPLETRQQIETQTLETQTLETQTLETQTLETHQSLETQTLETQDAEPSIVHASD